jgi:hypothetical protein
MIDFSFSTAIALGNGFESERISIITPKIFSLSAMEFSTEFL